MGSTSVMSKLVRFPVVQNNLEIKYTYTVVFLVSLYFWNETRSVLSLVLCSGAIRGNSAST